MSGNKTCLKIAPAVDPTTCNLTDQVTDSPEWDEHAHFQPGTRLVNENGQTLYLRGVNVEGWLTWPVHCDMDNQMLRLLALVK